MNGKIDKSGVLYIQRGLAMKVQGCIHGTDVCGDGCSHFGEPRPDYEVDMCTCEVNETGKTTLQLCQKTLTFDTLVDERQA